MNEALLYTDLIKYTSSSLACLRQSASQSVSFEVVRLPMSDRVFHLQLARQEMGAGKGSRGKYKRIDGTEPDEMKQRASLTELLTVLKPYFWGSSGPDAMHNRLRSFGTWVLVLCSKLCTLCAPLYLAKATNAVSDMKWSSIVKYILIFNALKWAAVVLTDLRAVVFIKVKQQASMELQEKTFVHLHSLSLNWHLSKTTGSVIKSMDRGTDATTTLVTYIFIQLFPTLLECVSVVILFFVHFQEFTLGLLVLSGIVLYTIVTIVLSIRRKRFREESNKHDDDMHTAQTESLINFETVKYFTAENFELDRYKKSLTLYQALSSNTQLNSNLMSVLQQTVLCVTVLGAMIVSAKAVTKGNMSIGNWVAVQSWTGSIFGPLASIGGIVNTIAQALVDVRNLSALLMQQPDVVDSLDAIDLRESFDDKSSGMSVTFDNVHFNYPEQPVDNGLRDVSFDVPAGQTIAVVGSTGAGKTTISRLIFRFYDPLAGFVKLNGKDIKDFTQKSIREMIGVVPQDTVLFNESILYNIRYGRRDATFEEVVAAAESAQIKRFIESLPEKWDTVVGERGLKLSGGEKQRVAIARCLLKNPPLVLLDEATSALDSVTETSIQEALEVLGKNRTVVVIAHRLSTIRHADSIIVMDRGRLLEKGTHDDLLRIEGGEYCKLWNMQLGMRKLGPISKSNSASGSSNSSNSSSNSSSSGSVGIVGESGEKDVDETVIAIMPNEDTNIDCSSSSSTSNPLNSSSNSNSNSSSISSSILTNSSRIELGAINNV